MEPTNAGKVTNVILGGAIATVILGLAAVFAPEQVGALPTGFEGAIATIAAAVLASFGADPE